MAQIDVLCVASLRKVLVICSLLVKLHGLFGMNAIDGLKILGLATKIHENTSDSFTLWN